MEFEQNSEMLVPVTGTPPAPKRRSRALAVTGIVGLLAVGGGALALSRFLQTGTADPLAAIPAGADLVVTLDLEALASDRTRAFVNTLGAAFDEDPSADPMQEMIETFDVVLTREMGVTFTDDVAALLGKQAALAVLDFELIGSEPPPILIAIATRGSGAVDAFLAKVENTVTGEGRYSASGEEYAGTQLRILDQHGSRVVMAHIGDLVLIGSTRDSMTAAIDAYGDQPSMQDDPELAQATLATADSSIRVFLSQLPINPTAMSGLGALGLAGQQQDYLDAFQYAVFGVGITDAGLQIDGVTSVDASKLPTANSQPGSDPGFIAGLPSDTLGYLMLPSFWADPTFQDDGLLDPMGIDLQAISAELGFHPVDDFLAYLTSGLGISTTGVTADPNMFGILGSALVSNPDAVAATLEKLATYLQSQQVEVQKVTIAVEEFVSVSDEFGLPMFVFGLSGDRLLVGTVDASIEGFLGANSKLSSDSDYQAARAAAAGELGFFLDTQATLSQLASVLEIDQQELARMAPLGPIGMTTSSQADEQRFRMVWLVDTSAQ